MYHSAKRVEQRRQWLGWLAVVLLGLTVWIALRGIYLVVDEDRVIPCYAFSQQEALEMSGVILDPLDGVHLERKWGIGFLTILRAPRVTVKKHGIPLTVTTSGETAAQLLTRLHCSLGPEDVLSVPADTPLQAGMEISVDQVQHRQEVFTSVLPVVTQYRQDASAPWGEETVLDPGVEGEVRVTADVEYTNGRETGRRILRQEEITPPEPRVVSVGMREGELLPQIHEQYLILPDGVMLPYTKTLVVEATAYTDTDAGCNPVTATGTRIHHGTVCVDPAFIPYGTRMFIMASDGSYVYGIAQAEDCRAGIEGYRMDLYLPTAEECAAFDRRSCTVFVLG